ncbi:MAG: hypothetical protein H6748_05730 [Spirochaetaceae bacterium]|nr:hypothetical protein [Myxococcales bacterium]MCB9723530.1 hypothetical protein [Spirochaetaceae bacterium]
MGMGSDSGSDASREGRFDFARLEECVDFLLREHDRLSSEREALLGELREREHRLTLLEGRLGRERDLRRTALERVDKILAWLDQLRSADSPSVLHSLVEDGAKAAGVSPSGAGRAE